MRKIPYLAVCTISAFAMAALPIQIDIASKSFDTPVAHAKSGNGGKGGSGGKSGSKGGSSSNGKSASANGRGKGGQHVASASVGKAFQSVFGNKSAQKRAEKRVAKSKVKSAKANNRTLKTQIATLPEAVSKPNAKPKNFHAKLGALNSLKRNYHAYLNSQSPRFAAVAAFVKASAAYELALDSLKVSEQDLLAAQQAFSAAVAGAGITTYDGATGVYQDATVESLTARLDALKGAVVDPGQEASLQAEIAAMENLLAGMEATSVADAKAELEAAQTTADTAAVGTDDEALRQALLDMANDNRVAQYGDDYVDAEMMDWAKEVLGVDDAFGKIDEVKAEIAAPVDESP